MKELDTQKVYETLSMDNVVPMCSGGGSCTNDEFIDIISKVLKKRNDKIDEMLIKSIQVQLNLDLDKINIYRPNVYEDGMRIGLDLDNVIATIPKNEAIKIIQEILGEK